MAQNTVDFSTDMTGKVLLDTRLTPMQENILTSNSGTTTPVYAKKGTVWLNDGNGKLNVFDGTNNDPLLYEKTGVPMWDVNLATRYEQNAVVGYLKDGNYTFYRNLTGAGTTTPPDEDSVNWGKLETGNENISLDSTITNCLLKIPQDIKLELNNGTLTLKAGSKVYDGNGLFKAIESDLTLTPSGYTDVPHVAFVTEDGTLYARAVVDCASGDTTPSTDIWLYYNTTDKKVYQIENGVNVGTASLPLCVFIVSGGTASKITQVFNGFGYIGNTIFALPNTEGLIPNKRNADGSLKNDKFKTTGVLTYTLASRINSGNIILSSGGLGVWSSALSKYDQELNLNEYNETSSYVAISGTVSTDSTGRITSLNPKQTFQAVDRNEADYIVDSGSSTEGNQTAHYKLFKSGLLIQWGTISVPTATVGTITFLKPYQDTNYTVLYTPIQSGGVVISEDGTDKRTETSCEIKAISGGTLYEIRANWYIVGQGATE